MEGVKKVPREGKEYWDKICSVKRYGFIHSQDNSRVLKVEGLGSWIDMYEAQNVVDAAQDEINSLRSTRKDLLEALQNLENDNGQIPDHAWKLVQDAIAKATTIQ